MTKRRKQVRMSSTGYSSARYGACECCQKHVAEVWIGTADDGYTHTFGHRACVKRELARQVAAAGTVQP